MRHVNGNCDLTIQAIATRWFVDVIIRKLRKRYSTIIQICWNSDLSDSSVDIVVVSIHCCITIAVVRLLNNQQKQCL